MQAHDCAEEDAPEHDGPAAKNQQADAERRNRDPMPLADERVEFILAQIGNIGKQRGGMVVQRAPGHDPAHVRPETAVAGRMRIALHVSILVMDSVRRHPEKRAAFKRQCGADGDEIFEPLIRLKSTVREQPMIRNANAKAAGNPPQKQRDEKSLPREHEKRCDRAYVECDHEKSGELPDGFPKRSIPLEKIHECESPWWFVPAYLIQAYQRGSGRIVILV